MTDFALAGAPDLRQFVLGMTGIKLSDTLFPSVQRFVDEKLAENGCALGEYLSLVRSDQREFDALMERVTVGETYFFRDERQFELIDSVVFPSFRESGRASFLAWSAACSTGEEALSLSLLFHDRFLDSPDRQCRVYATDINRAALDVLGSGAYRKTSIRPDGSSYHALLDPYLCDSFLRGVLIEGPVLESVEPLYLNLSSLDYWAIPNLLDVVFLRNVMIYIEGELRERIFGAIADKLRVGGIVFISATEIPFFAHPDLELREWKGIYYYEKLAPSARAARDARAKARPAIGAPGLPAKPVSPKDAKERHARPARAGLSGAASARASGASKAGDSVKANVAAKKDEPEKKTAVDRTSVPTPGAEGPQGANRAAADEARACYELIDSDEIALARAKIRGLGGEYGPSDGFWGRALWDFLSGYCDLREGDTKSAIDAFSRCLESRPDFWIARYHRGILELPENAEAARRDFKKAELDIGAGLASGNPFPDFLLEGFNGRYFREMCGKWLRKIATTGERHGN